MSFSKKSIMKLSNFYVSDWHLLTCVLNYLKDENINTKPIVFISEKNLKMDFDFLLSRLNLNDTLLKKLKNIPWYDNCNNLGMCDNSIYIVNGSCDYISSVNNHIQDLNTSYQSNDITVIDCFDSYNNDNLCIADILNTHDKILSTAGIKEINEVFPEYKVCKGA